VLVNDEQARRYIAGEIRAEMTRQLRTAGRAAAVLRKSKQAWSKQWRGETDIKPQELLALAEWLEKPVEQFLPPGYTLMVVRRDVVQVAS
jgi:hypothetical protein